MKRLLFTAISVLLCTFASADDGWGYLKLKEAIRDYVTSNLGSEYSFTIVSVDTIDHLKPDSTTMAIMARISEYENFDAYLKESSKTMASTPKSTLINISKMNNPSVSRFVQLTRELGEKIFDDEFEEFVVEKGYLKEFISTPAEIYSVSMKVFRDGETDSTAINLYSSTHDHSDYVCDRKRPQNYDDTFSEKTTDAYAYVSGYLSEIIPLMAERNECWKVVKSLIRKQKQAPKKNVHTRRR